MYRGVMNTESRNRCKGEKTKLYEHMIFFTGLAGKERVWSKAVKYRLGMKGT